MQREDVLMHSKQCKLMAHKLEICIQIGCSLMDYDICEVYSFNPQCAFTDKNGKLGLYRYVARCTTL